MRTIGLNPKSVQSNCFSSHFFCPMAYAIGIAFIGSSKSHTKQYAVDTF